MGIVTIYTDASYCHDTGAGGWGAWVRRDRERRLSGGQFKAAIDGSTTAEMAAAANGVAFAVASRIARPGDRLVVVSDSACVVENLAAGSQAARHGAYGPMVAAARALAARNGLTLQANKVPAHSGDDNARAYVNDVVDKEARKHMLAMRQRLLADQARQPLPEDGVLAFHGTFFDVVAFRPMSHFGTAQAANDRLRADWRWEAGEPGARVYPVLLDIRNPLRMRDLGNHTSVDVAAALWREGIVGEAFARAVVKRVAHAERARDIAGYARSCGNVGITDGWAWVRDAKAAEAAAAKVTPDQFVDAFWSRHGSPEGLVASIRDCRFPAETASCRAADTEVARVIAEAGYDGVEYQNRWEDKGAMSMIVLRPEQVRVIPSPALAPASTRALGAPPPAAAGPAPR